jgi:Trypsin-co-occurring domain 2
LPGLWLRAIRQRDIVATIWSLSVVLGVGVSEPWIGLSDAIAALRAELVTAMTAGQSEKLHFELGPVELEFTVDVHKDGGADGGIRWGVISFGASGSAGSAAGHRVKLVLQPKDVASGGNAEVGSSRR